MYSTSTDETERVDGGRNLSAKMVRILPQLRAMDMKGFHTLMQYRHVSKFTRARRLNGFAFALS